MRPSYRWIILALAFCGGFSQGLLWLASVPLVLHVERDLNSTAAQIGLWVNIHLVITAALSLPIGVMVDGWGARRVGLLGAGLMAAGGIARGFAVSYPTLQASSAVFGLGFIGLFVAIPKMLSRWFCSRELGLATGVFLTGYGAGSVAGLVIVHPLFGCDWQSCFRSLGLVGVLMVVAWFRFGLEPEQALPAAEFRQPRRNALRAALGTQITWVLTLMFFCYAAGFTAWFTFGFPFLVRFRQIPERYGGLILALTMVGYTLASTSMPALSDRVGKRRPFLLFFPATASALFVALAVWPSSAGAASVAFLLGFCFGTINPLIFTVAGEAEKLGPSLMGVSVGVISSLGSTSGFVVPLTVGKLLGTLTHATQRDFTLAWMLAAALVAGMLVCSLGLAETGPATRGLRPANGAATLAG